MTDERRWLVVFDTDQIKNYILSTPDLGRMRGASVLLEHLNRATSEDIQELPADLGFAASALTLLTRYASPGYGVVAAGGMAAAVVSSESEAHRLIEEMRRLYLTATRIASVSGAAVDTTVSKHLRRCAQRETARVAQGIASISNSRYAAAGGRRSFVTGMEHSLTADDVILP